MIKCKQCNELTSNKSFCSVKCTCTYNNNNAKTYGSPCLECGELTKNPEYCSRKCYNENRISKPRKKYYCQNCSDLISVGWTHLKICKICRSNKMFNWQKYTLKELKNKYSISQYHAKIRGWSRTIFNQSKKPKICKHCNYSKYIEVCHIKDVKDFSLDSTLEEVNHIDNLIALCRNCHWEFDHGHLKISCEPR